jgi:hypothetical protein
MSDTAVVIERDAKSGQFVKGYKGGPGRGVGSRNRLTTEFLDDLRDTWLRKGKAALERCAEENPDQFCRIVANLLPREASLDIDVTIRAQNALEAFRMVRSLPRDELLQLRQIDADTE